MVSEEDFEILKARVRVLEESASEKEEERSAEERAAYSFGEDEPDTPKPFEMWCDDFDEDSPGAMKMFLPEGSILWNGENVPIENVENDELVIPMAAGWICGHVFEGEDGESHYATIDRNETAEGSVVDFKIAKTRDDTTFSDDEGNDYQVFVGAVNFGGGGGADPDEASTDLDESKRLELYHFKDGKQDSGKGLVQRIKADPQTGSIASVDSSGVMLVARKDGKLIYVPLDGEGEDPGGSDPVPGGEQCQHDKPGGKEGGVAPSMEPEPGGGGGGAGGVPAGGVAAGGDHHVGDDGCNCN